MFSVPSQPAECRGERLGEFRSRSVKTREFSQTLPRFSPGYEGKENMFFFFYKIIDLFSFLTKRKTIYEALMLHFNFFRETVNSHNLETAVTLLLTPFSCFIALWKHNCRPIKTHVLSRYYFINWFNNKLILTSAFHSSFLFCWISPTIINFNSDFSSFVLSVLPTCRYFYQCFYKTKYSASL